MNVYFLRTGDAIKVGIASDINQRMINIQVGNPHKIELLHSISTSESNAKKIESQIHEIFRKTNLNGEWFQATQYMHDFINHIKDSGWESHSNWINEQYQRNYGAILKSFKSKIEQDIVLGNLVSLDRLKLDLGKLVNTIFMIPSLPTNMAEAIREWVKKRKDPFVLRDIYNDFGISTRKGKTNTRVILNRLVSDGTLERTGNSPKCLYRSK